MIDSRSRLVVVTAEGQVTRADFEEYLEVVTGAGANGYAKIFDGTRGENAMTREDMLALAGRFREMHAQPHGPLAIVLQPDRQARLEPVLGALATADRHCTCLRPCERRRLGSKGWQQQRQKYNGRARSPKISTLLNNRWPLSAVSAATFFGVTSRTNACWGHSTS
jgi:hypothetical protein